MFDFINKFIINIKLFFINREPLDNWVLVIDKFLDLEYWKTTLAKLLYLEQKIKWKPVIIYFKFAWWEIINFLSIHSVLNEYKIPYKIIWVWNIYGAWSLLIAWWKKWTRFCSKQSLLWLLQDDITIDLGKRITQEDITKTIDILYTILSTNLWITKEELIEEHTKNLYCSKSALVYWLIDWIVDF